LEAFFRLEYEGYPFTYWVGISTTWKWQKERPIDVRFMLKKKVVIWDQMTFKNGLTDIDHHL